MNRLITLREWMYNQRVPGRSYNNDTYMDGVVHFIEMAKNRGCVCDGNLLRCPCSKCRNRKFQQIDLVEDHLYRNGFVPNYYNWTLHGESVAQYEHDDNANYQSNSIFPDVAGSSSSAHATTEYNNFQPTFEPNVDSHFDTMVHDITAPMTFPEYHGPSDDAMNYYNMWKYSCEPAYEGCSTETELSIHMKLMQHKTDNNISDKAYDGWMNIQQGLLDRVNKAPTSFKQSKKLLSDLGMSMQRIDACVDGCMIYYKEDENLMECKFCGEPRFHVPLHGAETRTYKRKARKSMFYLPIIPRVQRLFMAPSTAAHMSWHSTRDRGGDTMVHPSDGQSWKFFNQCYPDFASDSRNVRLGLCSDGFSPYGMSAKSYSCWPVMMTAYNLPPWMCMKTRFIWLTILIPGPSSPKKRIDVYLRPLIDDLITLWSVGVDTFDAHNKSFFKMRAALMWTISDFPAYGMLSGWSTAGRLGCPYCKDKTKSFWLTNGRKHSYFDCHRRFLPSDHPYRYDGSRFKRNNYDLDPPINLESGPDAFESVKYYNYIWEMHPDETIEGFGVTHNWTKKSIFWMLPYWINVQLRHNLDVMHIEKNVFENLFNTIMDVKGKTKDNGIRCREDLKLFCDRRELNPYRKGAKMVANRAKYQLTVPQQKSVLEWITTLKFPDGYGSRLGRHVDMQSRRLVGYKTHDAHVFIERLMPIAFRGMLPARLWEAVSEMSTFFKDICGSSLDIHRMMKWKANIVETICKLEIFFPPSFFDSMEHLPIHVAEEMVLGGPVQYRWMYPFERFIYRLKKLAKNKSKPEASIVEAYLQQEITFFGSDYLGPEFRTNANQEKRNEVMNSGLGISIYNYPGKGGSVIRKRNLTEEEFRQATYYILNNTPELDEYFKMFQMSITGSGANITQDQMLQLTINHFSTWLQQSLLSTYPNANIPTWLVDVAMGFETRVTCHMTYKVNNYKFTTEVYSEHRRTVNCQVHVTSGKDSHFYGVIEDILYIQTRRNKEIGIVLFKCRWFDPANNRSYPTNGIVEVNTQRLYRPYDPFILAQQADQVYYTQFPGLPNKSSRGWEAACKMKPTNTIDLKLNDIPFQEDGAPDSTLPDVVHVATREPLANDLEVNEYDVMVDQDNNAEDVADDESDDDWISDNDEPSDDSV